MFHVCSIEEAKKRITQQFPSYELEVEIVSLFQALNRYLAEDIVSKWDVPHFNRSTVDGYAIKSRDVMGASESLPAYLNIVGEVEMGKAYPKSLDYGEAIYVPTGGALPTGADCVVMIEDTETLNQDELFVYTKVSPKENVLFKGEDIKCDQLILPKGKHIKAQDLGVLSSIGYHKVKVFKKIKYTVISTGDEIVNPHVEPQIGEVRDMNSYTISGEILARYGDLVEYKVIRDEKHLLKEQIEQAIKKSDIVVLSGGSSVGHKDLTHQLLEEIEPGSVFVHGVAIKPGKPTILANVQNKLVIGLPGQPASALLVFKTFIDLIESIYYENTVNPQFYLEASLTKNIHSTKGRETYQMVSLVNTGQGYLAEPIYGKSGTITLIASAEGYIIIPANCEGLSKFDRVKVYQW